MKSRGVITPWSLPPRSVTTRYSALRSSMRISASAADSPSATVGTEASMTSRAGAVACLPSTSTRLRSSASVTSPKRPSSKRHDGVPGAAARHRGGDVADRVVGVDHQRVGLDELVDEAVGGQAPRPRATAALRGEEPGARAARRRRARPPTPGSPPRSPRRRPPPAARPTARSAWRRTRRRRRARGAGRRRHRWRRRRATGPPAPAMTTKTSTLDLREGVEDELARPEPRMSRRPGHRRARSARRQPVERRGLGQRRGRGPPRRRRGRSTVVRGASGTRLVRRPAWADRGSSSPTAARWRPATSARIRRRCTA